MQVSDMVVYTRALNCREYIIIIHYTDISHVNVLEQPSAVLHLTTRCCTNSIVLYVYEHID